MHGDSVHRLCHPAACVYSGPHGGPKQCQYPMGAKERSAESCKSRGHLQNRSPTFRKQEKNGQKQGRETGPPKKRKLEKNWENWIFVFFVSFSPSNWIWAVFPFCKWPKLCKRFPDNSLVAYWITATVFHSGRMNISRKHPSRDVIFSGQNLMPKIITLHDVLEPLNQVHSASRDVIISGQICGSKLQRAFTLGDGCWLPMNQSLQL